LPELAREDAAENSTSSYVTYSFLGGAYLLSIPFFVGLFHTHKLLNNIDRNKAFTNQSINALQNIKLCAVVFSGLTIAAMIAGITVARSINPTEDVTFMVPMGLILISVSGVIAVFIAVLQRLLADAVALKSENDLIV
jgi:hypothetical protein